MPANDTLTLPLGVGRPLFFTYTDKLTGAPVDLTGAQITFSVKRAPTDQAFIFQKKNQAAGGSDSDVLITDAVNGKASIFLQPSDSTSLQSGQYAYDVKVVLGGFTDFPSIGVLQLVDHPGR